MSGTGSKQYKEPIDILCYADGKVKVITDNTGSEVVSNKQLYISGTIHITEDDAIIFEGRERNIKSLTAYYRGGKVDIWVVFL